MRSVGVVCLGSEQRGVPRAICSSRRRLMYLTLVASVVYIVNREGKG